MQAAAAVGASSSTRKFSIRPILFWIILTTLAAGLYYAFETTHDNSHRWLVGDWIRTCTIAALLGAVYREGNASGVSVKMVEAWIVATAIRICTTTTVDNYIPGDTKWEHWTYRSMNWISLVGLVLLNVIIRTSPKDDREHDVVEWYYMMPVCALISSVVHPDMTGKYLLDAAWMASVLLESVVVFPQVFLMNRSRKLMPFAANFVILQFISKLLFTTFWTSWFQKGYRGAFTYILIGQIISLMLLSDFVYRYFQCVRFSRPLESVLLAAEV